MTDPADAVIGLYERHAARYVEDRSRVGWNERAWLDRFCGLLPAGGSVLDIGCGCGDPVARHLIDRGYAVDGVDSSATLIGRCRERFPLSTWRVADMRTLALGRVYDGLLAWDSLFHLNHDDQRAMFGVFARHAARGAVLMFTSGPSHGEALGSYHGEVLYHASLASAEYRALLNVQGFAVQAHVTEDPECGGHTIWLARRDPETAVP